MDMGVGMNQDNFVAVVDETLTELLAVADEYLEEITAQFEDVGSPEKLIGKPFEEWTQQDLMLLSRIYGPEEPNALSNLIFRKKYEEVKALEAEEA